MDRRGFKIFGRIFGALALIIVALEFRGAFAGNLAFARKPTLVLTPLHAPNLDSKQIAAVRLILERELAGPGNHALYPKSLIENFYLERDNAIDVFNGTYRGKAEALALGEALGVNRIALVSIYGITGTLSVSLNIHDVATDQKVAYQSIKFSDYQSLLDWVDVNGKHVDLGEEIGSTVPGLSAGAWLYLLWLGLLVIPAVILLLGRFPWRGLLENCITLGLLLALFSWIYALNGDMDYVQRFVATSGSLSLEDTAAERSATLWRYLAPMILLTALWGLDAARRLHRRRELGQAVDSAAVLESSAPLLVILSAFLFAFSLPNFVILEGLSWLAWFAMAPLYIALRRSSWRRGVSLLLLYTGLQSLLVNWWQGTFCRRNGNHVRRCQRKGIS